MDFDNPHLVEILRAKPTLDAIDPETAEEAAPPRIGVRRSSLLLLIAGCAVFWAVLVVAVVRF